MIVWILTSVYNDYNQYGKNFEAVYNQYVEYYDVVYNLYGEHYEAVFSTKPTSEQIQKIWGITEIGASHILNGGGREKYEDQWYNLKEHEL